MDSFTYSLIVQIKCETCLIYWSLKKWCIQLIGLFRAEETADSKVHLVTKHKCRITSTGWKKGEKRQEVRTYKPQEEARMVVGPVWGLLTTLTLLRANTALYHPGRERSASARIINNKFQWNTAPNKRNPFVCDKLTPKLVRPVRTPRSSHCFLSVFLTSSFWSPPWQGSSLLFLFQWPRLASRNVVSSRSLSGWHLRSVRKCGLTDALVRNEYSTLLFVTTNYRYYIKRHFQTLILIEICCDLATVPICLTLIESTVCGSIPRQYYELGYIADSILSVVSTDEHLIMLGIGCIFDISLCPSYMYF